MTARELTRHVEFALPEKSIASVRQVVRVNRVWAYLCFPDPVGCTRFKLRDRHSVMGGEDVEQDEARVRLPVIRVVAGRAALGLAISIVCHRCEAIAVSPVCEGSI
jgi:hypothetical protein